MRATITTLFAVALTGCATTPPVDPKVAAPVATATVQARGETQPVGTGDADAADDPAIWRNPVDPAASLIVGTDKKAGLYVYGLDGRTRDFVDAGRVNNVDIVADVPIAGKRGILVVASDRNDVTRARLALFRLDPSTAKLIALGTVDAGTGESYGLCLGRDARGVSAFAVLKDGTINQIAVDASGAAPVGRIVRTMKLATQSEGCAVDNRTHRLYVAEEDAGLWRFDASARGSVTPVRVAVADGRHLVADAEGVTIAPIGRTGGYLIVSSQGDNAYAVYDLRTDRYIGRFRIGAGTIGSTEETDGITLSMGDFGPTYPGGLFIAQDGRNAPHAQNFKLVAWADIVATLNLRKR